MCLHCGMAIGLELKLLLINGTTTYLHIKQQNAIKTHCVVDC